MYINIYFNEMNILKYIKKKEGKKKETSFALQLLCLDSYLPLI